MTLVFTRRECLRFGLAAGGAMVVGWDASGQTDDHPLSPVALALWLLIDADGTVTFQSNASDMGQGSTSGLAQIVSEELEIPWGEIRVAMAPIQAEYFGLFNDYVTGGSATIRGMFEKLRIAAATARDLLLTAAAQRWGVEMTDCSLRAGTVTHAQSRRVLRIGELVSDAAKISLPKPAVPKPRDRWTIVGKEVTRLDLHSKVTGLAQFGIDAGPKSSRIAVIKHAPTFGSRLEDVTAPDSTAHSFVVVRLSDAVAVVANDYWTATKVLEKLQCQWSAPDKLADVDDYRAELRKALDRDGEIRNGPTDQREAMRSAHNAAFASASKTFEAIYETPLLAHACMEPMNATALYSGNRLELWVPTQVQAAMRRDVAKALDLPESAVTIHTTLLGGGFGRRLATDYGVQAALIARAVEGPVKLIWPREEDLQHDFYRQAAMMRLRCAFDASGEILALRAHAAALGSCSPHGMPGYAIPHFLRTNNDIATRIPLGAWRAVESNHNTFFLESFLDEVAFELKIPPLQLRRKLLAQNPRALRVLNAAVEASGMEHNVSADRHFGVALCTTFGSLCAQVVEISVNERSFHVHLVTCALDCGTAVNPDSVRAQIEGCVIMALSAACFEKVTVKGGRVTENNLIEYPVLRFGQVPPIRSIILDSPNEPIGGCGEPPIPPLAPALTNALFAATGARIRSLPLSDAGWTLA